MIPSMTLGELKDKVQQFIGRTDEQTLDQIPFFINLAEKQIYRNLRIPEFEEVTDLVVDSEGRSTIPKDLQDFKHLYTTTKLENDDRGMDLLVRCSLSSLNNTQTGFARVDNDLWFTKDLPEGSKVKLVYYKRQEELVKDTDTSIMLEIAPDVVLFATLSIAGRFNNDAEEQQRWHELYQAHITQLFTQNENFEYSGGTLVIQTPNR